MYHIMLKTDNMIELRRKLYFLPVNMVLYDVNDVILSNSYRNVPEGKDMIH